MKRGLLWSLSLRFSVRPHCFNLNLCCNKELCLRLQSSCKYLCKHSDFVVVGSDACFFSMLSLDWIVLPEGCSLDLLSDAGGLLWYAENVFLSPFKSFKRQGGEHVPDVSEANEEAHLNVFNRFPALVFSLFVYILRWQVKMMTGKALPPLIKHPCNERTPSMTMVSSIFKEIPLGRMSLKGTARPVLS